MTQNVIITGASAGIARATAQQFGARRDNVGLLARGQAGLDGSVRAVEAAGGKALAMPTDVSYATFSPGRSWDQLRVSVAYTQANVNHFGESGPPEELLTKWELTAPAIVEKAHRALDRKST